MCLTASRSLRRRFARSLAGVILCGWAASQVIAAADSSTLPMRPGREITFTTEEGTSLSPDLSPNGRLIAFELLGELYAVDSKGGVARPSPTDIPFDSQPV